MHTEDPYREYTAIITKVKNFGIYFEIIDLLLEGFVHISELEEDYFVYEEPKMRLRGTRHGSFYAPSDKVTVMLKEVDFILQETKWYVVASEQSTLKSTSKPNSSKKRPHSHKKHSHPQKKQSQKKQSHSQKGKRKEGEAIRARDLSEKELSNEVLKKGSKEKKKQSLPLENQAIKKKRLSSSKPKKKSAQKNREKNKPLTPVNEIKAAVKNNRKKK